MEQEMLRLLLLLTRHRVERPEKAAHLKRYYYYHYCYYYSYTEFITNCILMLQVG